MKTVFTTGQAAKIAKVAPRTVSKWFDSGRLKGYRIPGSQDRRIPREHLIKFLKEHGMPLGELEDEELFRIVFFGVDDDLRDRLQGQAPEATHKALFTNDLFEAGQLFHELNADCVVLNTSLSTVVTDSLVQSLRKRDNPPVLIAVHEQGKPPTNEGFSERFSSPFDPVLLMERIETLVKRKKQAA